MSTYDTDYILVQQGDLNKGIAALARGGHCVVRASAAPPLPTPPPTPSPTPSPMSEVAAGAVMGRTKAAEGVKGVEGAGAAKAEGEEVGEVGEVGVVKTEGEGVPTRHIGPCYTSKQPINVPVPARYVGLWRRDVEEDPPGTIVDMETTVLWMQTSSLYAGTN